MVLTYFLEQLKVGDIVVVPIENWDMEGTWHENMSAMVGEPLRVRGLSRSRGFISLFSDVVQCDYQFYYTEVYPYHTFVFPVQIGDVELVCHSVVDRVLFDNNLTSGNFDKLMKICGKDRKVSMSPEIIEKIRKTCPQVIGTMLYNKLLVRKEHVAE